MSDWYYNERNSLAGDVFCGWSVVGGVAAQRSYVALWNPLGSGKNILVDKSILLVGTAAQGGDIRKITSSYGTLHSVTPNGKNMRYGGGVSVAEIRDGNIAAGSLPTPLVKEFWPGYALKDLTIVFKRPYVLVPGSGLFAAHSHDNGLLGVNWFWRERDV